MAELCAVVLAAGEGKRMKSGRPKVLCEVLFKPMAAWVFDSIRAAGIEDVCLVTGHLHEQVEDYFGDRAVFAIQQPPLGTGHAVMQAAGYIRGLSAGQVLVACGDAPLIEPETIRAALEAHLSEGNGVTAVTTRLHDPAGYGRILRDADGALAAIVEEKDAGEDTRAITEINAGLYWFRRENLLSALERLTPANAQGEYYLTDAVGAIREAGGRAGAYLCGDSGQFLGANDRLQLLELNREAARRVLLRHLTNGVGVVSDSGLIIGPDVVIGRDTLLLPGCILRGRTVIGEGCVIGPNALIDSSTVGDRVTINSSQLYESEVGGGTRIGPFSHLRPHTRIGCSVKIGNFNEFKNSVVGDRTSVAHLSYIGDADVGGGVNIGCGCVTVNYDGKKKHRTVIEDKSFVGCNSNLVAPVTVGEGSYVAAGSTITRDVPPGSLAVARERQVNKEGWMKKREV